MRALLLAAMLAGSASAEATDKGGRYSSAWLTPFDKFSAQDLGCFDELNPFALAFDPSSNVVESYPELLRQARETKPEGAKLVPAVVNDVMAQGGKEQSLKSVPLLEYWLGDEERLLRHVDDLVRAAAPYDGLELDYERLPEHLYGPFTRLVSKLAERLHAQGKTLALDVEPQPLYRRGGALAKQYWPSLGGAADKIKIMCYYERGAFSDKVGPGTSTAWVEDTARRALAVLPAGKISLAFSLAATDWEVPLARLQIKRHVARLHFRQARKLERDTGAAPEWDESFGAPFFRYAKDGRSHEVWYEDERSLKAKTDVARSLGLGVSLWYLGQTRPDLKAAGFCK